jgi:membrane-associated protease RseP (regulator of RpoE activity)
MALNYFVIFMLVDIVLFATNHMKSIFNAITMIVGSNIIGSLFARILLTVLFTFLFSVLAMFFLGFMLHLVVKAYKGSKDYKATVEALIYSLSPLLIITLLASLNEGILQFFVKRPFIILLAVVYTGFILKNAVQNIHKMESVGAAASVIIVFVYVYILASSALQTAIFYSAAILLIYYFRQYLLSNGGVLMYKSKIGLGFMEKAATSLPGLFSFLGTVAIVIGFTGMLAMSVLLVYNIYELIFVPGTLPAISPILPGVDIPGSPITTPLWYTLIAILIVVVVHEFSHGIIARLYKIPVKSSGLFFLGPITGAFVEPEEKALKKKSYRQQLAVFAAGPFSNILFAILVILLFGLQIPYLVPSSFTQHTAVLNLGEIVPSLTDVESYRIDSIVNNSAAQRSGLKEGMKIIAVDGINIKDTEKVASHMEAFKPGQAVEVQTTESLFVLTLKQNPKLPERGQMGISFTLTFKTSEAALAKYGSFGVGLLDIISNIIFWLILISLGIGIANLLPLGPVDGGRMLQVLLWGIIKDKEKADKIWQKTAILFIIMVLFILTFQLFKWAGMQLIG